jgi:phosphoglycerate dehydrogenase-like enzyme
MKNHTVLVLANPAEKQLAMLDALPPETAIAAGDNLAAFERVAADATVLFSWSIGNPLLRELWPLCPKVEWVHSRAAGLDTVLFPELIESPVPVTNGSGVFSPALGEFFLGAALYFAKGFRRMTRNQEAGRWDQFDIEEIAGQTVGIVGYGDIGRACASRAKAMGMKVLAVKRHAPAAGQADPFADRVYGPEGLAEALAASDFVVLAAPLTPETRSMISDAQFETMKSSAVLVNVGRGPVVDEAALVRALRAGRIRGAALDVFDKEPLPDGHPFYSFDNLLLSPHCADHTSDWLERAMDFFLRQFDAFASGRPLENVVDKRLGY